MARDVSAQLHHVNIEGDHILIIIYIILSYVQLYILNCIYSYMIL